MPRNRAHATLFAKSFPIVLRLWLGDILNKKKQKKTRDLTLTNKQSNKQTNSLNPW